MIMYILKLLGRTVDKWMWVLFWGIQLADIYSTHEGVKWDCISEANPMGGAQHTYCSRNGNTKRCNIANASMEQ